MTVTTVASSNAFSESQFQQHIKKFWAIPSQWRQAEHGYRLAELRRAGGDGVFCLLPILGSIAGLDRRHNYGLSIDRIAQLTGADPKSIQHARRAVEEAGLATASIGHWMGKRFTHWDVSQALLGLRADEESDAPESQRRPDYFYFPLRLVYGGTWALMPHRAKALYLGAALHASRFIDSVKKIWILEYLRDGVCLTDFERAHAYSAAGAPGTQGLRIACVSYAELSRVTGVSKDTLMKAASELKHPDDWQGVATDAHALEYMPLRVYPTREGNALMYLFRDHAPHLPWSATAEPNSEKPALLTSPSSRIIFSSDIAY